MHFILILLSVQSQAGVIHTNWSGGPSFPGPAPGGVFLVEENIEWAESPGNLIMEAPTERYTITDQIAGTRASIISADINSDGRDDIFFGTWNPAGIGWMENMDNGTTWTEHTISDLGAYQVDTADPDGDGDPDLLIACADGDILAWFENTGGIWIRHDITPSQQNPLRLCGADIDNDGDEDLLTFTTDQVISWFDNTDGSGTSWLHHQIWTFSSDQGLCCIEPAQLDSDSEPEILFALNEDGDIGFLDYQPLQRSWDIHYIENTYGWIWESIDAGDIDCDGWQDVVATRSDGGTYHVYWFENGNWDRTTIHQESSGTANYVRVRDLDDNGRPDVMVTEIEGQISAWLQTGDSSVDWYIRRGMINCTGSNQWVTSGDFDSDGVWDMAGLTSSSAGGKIQWFDYTTGGYPPYGSLTTNIFMVPFGTDLTDVLWGNMIWSAFEPDNTDIGFQVRASSDPQNMGSWTDTIWVNGEYLDPLLPIDGIFVQCIAHMMTADPDVTPILRWFCAEGCVPGGVEQEEDNSGNSISLALEVNPVDEAPCFYLTLPVAAEAKLTVYDIIGRIAMFENLGYLNAGTVTYQSSSLLPGIYFARLHAGNETAELRFIVISE